MPEFISDSSEEQVYGVISGISIGQVDSAKAIAPAGGGVIGSEIATSDTAEQTTLGASSTGGQPGTQVVTEEVDGDLGTRFRNLSTYLMIQESLRKNSTINGIYPRNMRYRGHREAFKFNMVIQNLLTQSVALLLNLRTANTQLQTEETQSMYPTSTEISSFYHAREQIRFKEWLLLKAEDQRWFV